MNSKTPIIRLSLYLDKCANSYGVLPCTAGAVSGYTIAAGAAGYAADNVCWGFAYTSYAPPNDSSRDMPNLSAVLENKDSGAQLELGLCVINAAQNFIFFTNSTLFDSGVITEIGDVIITLNSGVYSGRVLAGNLNGNRFTNNFSVRNEAGALLSQAELIAAGNSGDWRIEMVIEKNGEVWQTPSGINPNAVRCFNTLESCQDRINYKKEVGGGGELSYSYEGNNAPNPALFGYVGSVVWALPDGEKTITQAFGYKENSGGVSEFFYIYTTSGGEWSASDIAAIKAVNLSWGGVVLDLSERDIRTPITPDILAIPINNDERARLAAVYEANADRVIKFITRGKAEVGRVYRFISKSVFVNGYNPLITSYSHQPPEIKSDFSLWTRERIKIKMSDVVAGDTLLDDNYIAIRPEGEVNKVSSYLGRLLRRNVYFNRRRAVVEIGYMERGEFVITGLHDLVIDKVDFNERRGELSMDLVDGIRIKEADGAVAPKVSGGELARDVSETDFTMQVSKAVVGDYLGARHISIGGEIMSVISVSGDVGNVEIQVERAVRGSELGAHEAGDTVQVCYTATENIVEVVADLLENYADLGRVVIDKAGFDKEQETALALYQTDTIISKPTGVDKLLAELQKSGLFNVWYDSFAGVVKLRNIIGLSFINDVVNISDNDLLVSSVENKTEPRKSISRVLVYSLPRDFANINEGDKDWRHLQLRINSQIETADARGEAKQQTIYSRWISATIAGSMAARLLQTGKLASDYLKFDLPNSKMDGVEIGRNIAVRTYSFTDFLGMPEERAYRIVRIQSKNAEIMSVEAVLTIFGGNGINPFIVGVSRVGFGAII